MQVIIREAVTLPNTLPVRILLSLLWNGGEDNLIVKFETV